jgi:exopolysaccharide biosynthesis polyprenyl glycosylphosphotransferase
MQRVQAASLQWNLRVLDAAILVMTFVAVAWAREQVTRWWGLDLFPGDEPILAPVTIQGQLPLVIAILPAWLLALSFNGTYEAARRLRADVLLLRVALAVVQALAGLLLVLFIFPPVTPTSRTFLVGFAMASIAMLYVGRRIHARWSSDAPSTDILVVGNAQEAAPFVELVASHPHWGLRVCGVLRPDDEEVTSVRGVKVIGRLSELPTVLASQDIAQVFMTGRAWSTQSLRYVADSCEELGVTFTMDANFLGLSIARAEVVDLAGWSVLSFSSTPADAQALVAKRVMDVVGAAAGLLLASPLMLVVAALVKLEDGGPVLFSQSRAGLYGREFRMLKFRSMVVDAESRKAELDAQNEMAGPVFKMRRDPRVTRVGAFIRKLSIDELPQFWNVLRGDMSLVGPRPPIPAEVERYERWQLRRLSMRPGITCTWQVSGRNQLDFETWMRLDLEYIDNWSLFLDLALLMRTLPVVAFGRGAS